MLTTTSRRPRAVLAAVAGTAAAVTLPIVALHVAVVLSRWEGGYEGSPVELVRFAGPAAVGYLAAAVLWITAGSTSSRQRAWLCAAAGIVIVLAVSYAPVAGLAQAFAEERRETQPGGRGYYG